MYVFNS